MAWLDRIIARFLLARVDRRAEQIEAGLQADAMRCLDHGQNSWRYFNETLHSKDDVQLDEMIEIFAVPYYEFVRKISPQLVEARMFYMLLATSILEAKTHPANDINAAMEKLQRRYHSTGHAAVPE